MNKYSNEKMILTSFLKKNKKAVYSVYFVK